MAQSWVQSFRLAFPEFSNTTRYSDALITTWSTLAIAQVDSRRWGNQTTLGQQLYTAHEITLAAQNAATTNAGGTPTGQPGAVNSKTVGSVTVAYDVPSTIEKDAGWWNLTAYGRQFIRLARLFGAGTVQLGVSRCR